MKGLTMTDLAKLNRLRVNAGKTELKSWKASKAALNEAIGNLEAAGHSDALPGANIAAAPIIPDDPELKAAIEKPIDDPDNAMNKAIAKEEPKPKAEKRQPAKLARGLDTDQMARQSRYAVQMQREEERKQKKADRKAAKEIEDATPKPELTKAEKKALKKKRKAAKAAKLSASDKKQITDEAADRKPKIAGKVDEKKDPDKAKRQEKHVKDKQEARASKPKADKNSDEVTVAELCRELDIDPKVGRAKLRRHEDKLAPLHTKGQDRWSFPKSAGDIIRNILAGKK
jgi:hypothetical protein